MKTTNLSECEYEHIEAALQGCLPTYHHISGELIGFVATTLFQNMDNRALQECLAGLLREEGWTVVPPCPCGAGQEA